MAEKQLAAVRTRFVESVSKTVVSQLLDDLLEDGIMNDGENESILQENSIRRDQARCIIDIVRRKGDEASKKMILHLKNRDPTLYAKLGLSCVEPTPPAKDNEKMEKQDKNDVYPVTKDNIKSRVALLITNIKFTNEKLNRNGADKDEENMEKYLKSLGYEVVKHTNLTGQDIDAAVLKFSKHPKLKETDSVWVVIMSHGKLGAILGVNWQESNENPDHFKINNIYKYLNSNNCTALINKPKVIIIQACRGGSDVELCLKKTSDVTEKSGSALVSDSAQAAGASQSGACAAEDYFEDTVRYVNTEKDFITFLSCTPDTVSYRHPYSGSLLIQYIVNIFETSAQTDDIEELFRKVMQRFEEFSDGDKKQMATKDRCTLTKRFYLFPGL